MPSAKGNPTMNHLTMILAALKQELQVEITVQTAD
jgi:hypothetical protein